MNWRLLSLLCLGSLVVTSAQSAPVVSNVTAAQRANTRLVDIYYDLAAPAAVKVTLEISADDGATFSVPAQTLTGHVGLGVAAGTGKRIIWNAAVDWNGQALSSLRFRITADDRSSGMAYVPAGPFFMGRTSGDSDVNAPPVTVALSGYSMQTLEVTQAQWNAVREWGLGNGYLDLASGSGKAPNHPVINVTWYEALKWCNARSEMESLTPCYYTDAAHSTVYRTGQLNLTQAMVDPAANGYRLPTEAQWEKAARGGKVGNRFPWGEGINHDYANYLANQTAYSYDISPYLSNIYHPLYDDASVPYTSPAGSFPANGYGLHDMSGNAWEWCWDWYAEDGYLSSMGTPNPLGPPSGTQRILRGGSWFLDASRQRCSHRDRMDPLVTGHSYGFRPVQSGARAESTGSALSPAVTVSTPQPQVSQLVAAQRPGTKLVDISFDLAAPSTPTVKITLEISSDAGATFDVPVYSVSGAVGTGIAPGSGKLITWDAGTDWNDGFSRDMRFRVVADSQAEGLTHIPAGPTVMGRFVEDSAPNAPPIQVITSPLKLGTHEVSKALWESVLVWAISRGYTDLPLGGGKAADHPVHTVSWWNSIKWCNARSEMEGLTPCYTLEGQPMRLGTQMPEVNWQANGYRLPTEAEWEKAKRGGTRDRRFSWGNFIDHSHANFHGNSSNYEYDLTGYTVNTPHPTFHVAGQPFTAPVESMPTNPYGLFHMAGNIWEWCWDWRNDSYYTTSNGTTDPRGPASGTEKIRRGGSWQDYATHCRDGLRASQPPGTANSHHGFRVARGLRAADLEPGAAFSSPITVNATDKSEQTIDFAGASPVLATETVTLTATGGGSGNPVTFELIDGPGLISEGNQLTFLTAGTVRITASQSGNSTHFPALPVTREWVVNKAPADLIVSGLVQTPADTPRTVTVDTLPLGLTVHISYDGSATPPTALGRYEVLVEVDDPRYHGSVARTLFIDHRGDRDFQRPVSPALPAEAFDIPWENAASGLYDGLLRDATDGHTLLGAIETLRISTTRPNQSDGGTVTGRLRLAGLAIPLRGRFTADGTFQTTIPRRDGTTVIVSLTLQRSSAGHEVVIGSVSWNGLLADARLPRAPFHNRRQPVEAAWAGDFTLLLPSEPGSGDIVPGGDGWARLSISQGGAVRVIGRYGDGTPMTETAYLSAAGECALFAELYRSTPVKGRFGGCLTFRDLPQVSDCDGRMQWIKLTDSREKRYPAGFAVEGWALGSRYTPPATGGRMLAELAEAEPNASLSLIAANLPASEGEIERVISWLASNRLRHYGPDQLSGSANRRTGQINGSFRATEGSTPLSLTGVVLQKQGLAGGQFVSGSQTGTLRILPGTDFAFPGSETAGLAQSLASPQDPPPPLTLQPRNFEQAAAGSYGGVLTLTGAEPSPTGAIEEFRVSKSGSATGLLWVLGQRYPLRTVFDVTGQATSVINRPGLPSIVVNLQLRIAAGTVEGYQLVGTVSIGSTEYLVDVQRLPVHTRQSPAPQAGAYTLALAAADLNDPTVEPGGDGFALLKVSHLARCTGSLVLADGIKTTFSGHVSRSGEWSLHRSLYGRQARGFVVGKAVFRDEPGVSDVDGVWRWVKQGGAPSPLGAYPGGIDTLRQLVGSRYTPPARNARAWPTLADDWYNAWARFAGPTLATTDRAITWTQANRLIYFGPDPLSAKVSPKTGLVTGTYRNPLLGLRIGFGGVLLQKQGVVSGSYQTSSGSGRFWMEKR